MFYRYVKSRKACKPNFVPRQAGAVTIYLVPSLLTGSSNLPDGVTTGNAYRLLGFAPREVFRASEAHARSGGLLPRLFTLTPDKSGAVCFLWHCLFPFETYPLGSTVPVGVRTFLPILSNRAITRLSCFFFVTMCVWNTFSWRNQRRTDQPRCDRNFRRAQCGFSFSLPFESAV